MMEALETTAAVSSDGDSPLGRLLVERGFLTEEELQSAVEEQSRTGLPLGQVLIGLSYVTATTIAQVLTARLSSPPETAAEGSAPVAEQVQAAPVAQDASSRIAALELEVASARQAEHVARQAEQLARQQLAAARRASGQLGAAAARIAEVETSYAEIKRQFVSSMERSEQLERELSEVRQGAAGELQRTQHELAVTTENLRAAYARLHEYERAHAFQQQPSRQARAASSFAWQA